MSPPTFLATRLSALHAASFFAHGFYLPFFPLWLQSKGLDPSIIGIVVAIPIVVRILATAPLLSLADRSFGARRLLFASHIGQMIGFPLLLLVQDSAAIIALVALVSVTQAAVIPGNDLVTTAAVQRFPRLDYGRLRAFGSVAYFIANILAGYMVGAFGPEILPVALAVIPIMGIAATLVAVPKTQPEPVTSSLSEAPAAQTLPRVLWIIMIAAALTQASHGAVNAFGSIYWRSLGFADSTIGYFWAAGVIAEIVVFMFLGRAVGRGSGLGLLLIGSGAATIRFTMMAFQPDMATTLVLQSMHALSFGASHLGTMAALTALSPRHMRGRSQGTYGSVAALATALSTIASGVIYQDFGAGVFAAMAPLGLAGLVLTIVAMRILKAQPHKAG